jgi:hypothetical protein
MSSCEHLIGAVRLSKYSSRAEGTLNGAIYQILVRDLDGTIQEGPPGVLDVRQAHDTQTQTSCPRLLA